MNRFEKAAAFGAMMGKRALSDLKNQKLSPSAESEDAHHFMDTPDHRHFGEDQDPRSAYYNPTKYQSPIVNQYTGGGRSPFQENAQAGGTLNYDASAMLAQDYLKLLPKGPATARLHPKNSPQAAALRAFDNSIGNSREIHKNDHPYAWPNNTKTGPFSAGPSLRDQEIYPPFPSDRFNDVKDTPPSRPTPTLPGKNDGYIPAKKNPLIRDED